MTKMIRVVRNGPYEVIGNIPLIQAIIGVDEEGTSERWESGRKYPDKEGYFLCRCGASDDKPYCDGSHVSIGFDVKETATHGHGPRKHYRGAELDLIDEEWLCSSMRFCDRGPRAWNAAVNSDRPGYKDIAIEESCDCASGRLTAMEKDGTVHEPKFDLEISPIYDTASGRRGPLWVKGGIPIEDADGERYVVRNRATLCRCGSSENMPFCDRSHFQVKGMEGKD